MAGRYPCSRAVAFNTAREVHTTRHAPATMQAVLNVTRVLCTHYACARVCVVEVVAAVTRVNCCVGRISAATWIKTWSAFTISTRRSWRDSFAFIQLTGIVTSACELVSLDVHTEVDSETLVNDDNIHNDSYM